MKTRSKVKSVQANGTWNSSDGTLFYKFDYEMEDGVSLQAMHKSQNHFNPGDEVDYEITRTHETYGNSGKVGKPSDYGKKNDDYTKGVEVGHAINNAVNMVCAGVDLLPGEEFKSEAHKIYKFAEKVLQIADELKARR